MTEPVDEMRSPGDPEPVPGSPATADGAPRPVEPGEEGTVEHAGQPPLPPSRSGVRRPAFLVPPVAAVVLAVDQGSKYLAVHHLVPGERHDLIGSLMGLRLTRNAGAAFSMATGFTWIFTIIAAAVVTAIVVVAKRLGSYSWALAFGLLLGGALGNLSDRLFRPPGFARGHVIDFIDWPHWPIFNLADCCVVTAALLIALLSVLGLSYDGRWDSRDA